MESGDPIALWLEQARRAYAAGEQHPILTFLGSELEIEIAERGCDRDMNETDLDAYREKRMSALLADETAPREYLALCRIMTAGANAPLVDLRACITENMLRDLPDECPESLDRYIELKLNNGP